jgi:hypothetical protein
MLRDVIVVPIVVCTVCFAAGAVATARWLPDLARGPVGGLAFLTVCGLIGAALSLAGLDIYEIVELRRFQGDSGIVAVGIAALLRDSGTMVGVAAIVYLLAPARQGVSGEGGGASEVHGATSSAGSVE